MKRVTLAVCAAGLALAALPPATASAGPSPAPTRIAWQQLVHTGPASSVRSVAVDGDVVVAAGTTSNETGSPRLTVRVSRLRSGAPTWSDALGVTSTAQQVAAGGGVVAVAGYDLTNGQSSGFLVRAYDARTGRVLWTDRMESRPDFQGNALAVAVSGGKVYAGGYVGRCEFYGANGCVATLRAYDARSGAKAWEQTAGLPTNFSVFSALAVADGQLVAAGGTGGAGVYPSSLLVQSYDPATGALKWVAPVTTAKAGAVGGAFEAATSLAVGHGLVAVGGKIGSLSGATGFDVRTFDARTGAPRWHDEVPGGNRPDTVNGLAFTAKRIVAVGAISRPGGEQAYAVRAYDPASGKLAWEDRVYSAGKASAEHQVEAASGVVARGSRAYVVGRVGENCDPVDPGNCDMLVRAYDDGSGRQVWADRYDRAGRDDVGTAVALSGDRLIVGGSSAAVHPYGIESKWLLRAYEP